MLVLLITGNFDKAMAQSYTKYCVLNSKHVFVSENKLVIHGRYSKNNTDKKGLLILKLDFSAKYWDPNYYGSDNMQGKYLDKREFK